MQRLRDSFTVRWALALLCALAVTSGASFAVLSRQIERALVGHAAHELDEDVQMLEARLATASDTRAEQSLLQQHVEEMAMSDHVSSVGIVTAAGDVVFASGDGPPHVDDAAEAAALRGGEVIYGPEKDAGEQEDGRYQFVARVQTSAGPVLLEVDQNSEAVTAVMKDLRNAFLWVGLLTLGLTPLLSFVFGGARLGRHHRETRRLAETDELTGLQTRRAFRPALEATVGGREAHDAGSPGAALALIDVDDFKTVNDRLGHSYGDRVLVGLARAFEELRPGDRAYRLGGDEFAAILPSTHEDAAVALLERVRSVFQNQTAGVTFSAGIASTDTADDRLNPQELWERADAALYQAKRAGRARTVSFSGGMGLVVTPDRLEAIANLGSWRHRVSVAFQPIWDLQSGTAVGHEALLRLPDDLPFDGPADAFDVAARLGQAGVLDAVAREAALAAVTRQGWGDGLLFLNVHPEAVRGLDVIALAAQVTAAGIAPRQVVIEVTEQAELTEREAARVLKKAQAYGFRAALDDLGQGNAGLQALSRMRFDVVKLDRHVVARLGIDPAADATLAAAATFVQSTGGLLVAEGIEDSSHLDVVLKQLEPQLRHPPRLAGQGYLLGRPAAEPRPQSEHLDIEGLIRANASADSDL